MNINSSNADHGSGPKLVSIGVPIYKRLEYLPNVLKMVKGQDYPSIELIVSDNGQNGTTVRDMVAAQYPRPYRFRQNPSTVDVVRHHNQIIREAAGEYFLLLSDDDEISHNFVSELAGQLEQHPEASLAYSGLEIIDENGCVLRAPKPGLPVELAGPDFIRAVWETYELGFENVEGFLARTKLWQDMGGYPNFTKGNHIDDAAVIQLCLNHQVVFAPKCTFRHRVCPENYCRAVTMKELAAASKEFLLWLDHDPIIGQFAVSHSEEWRHLREVLEQMTWETYLWRWKDLYRDKLSAIQWTREAFRMPFIPAYYSRVARILHNAVRSRVKRWFVAPPGEQPAFKHGASLPSDHHLRNQ
jgi:glycosyltransferase involved in cell wall biosynthesis